MNAIFAKRIRNLMRKSGITIRELAASMNVTQKRVREVRADGRPPAHAKPTDTLWMQDWIIGINKAVDDREQLRLEVEAAERAAGWDPNP